jgi:GT2 family glycosyltransferase
MNNLSASIVAYKNPAHILAQTIHSFLRDTHDSPLFIIDNSPTDRLKYLAYDPRITYIFNNRNVGFGAGHNLVLKEVLDKYAYHLVLNPDVYFEAGVMKKLHSFMESHPGVGQLMPKVLYPDGRLQPLCRLLPSPKTLIMRRFFGFLKKALERENFQYELHRSGYNQTLNVPFLSGCFMLLRTEALKKVGLFDERFFLYTEDTDLTRRIHKYYQTLYYPEATIYHYHERGSYKNIKLLGLNIVSAIRYFNKWGWTHDEEREFFNQRTLSQLKVSV